LLRQLNNEGLNRKRSLLSSYFMYNSFTLDVTCKSTFWTTTNTV